MNNTNKNSKEIALNVLTIAVWMGILAGIGEGLLYMLLQRTGRLVFANEQLLWIAPLFDLVLFLLIGFGIILLGLIFRKIPIQAIAVFIFSFLVVLDWIGLVFYERLYPWAIVIFAVGLAITVLRGYRRRPVNWMSFWKKSLPYGLGLVLCLLLIVRGGNWLKEQVITANLPSAPSGAPNVLFVVVDTLRSDHLSSNGYPRETSPNLDRLAATGTSFTHAYSTSSYSLTSHVSLMTGKNNFEHGIEWDNPTALKAASFPTIAEVMKKNGYRTGGFSANNFWVTKEEGFDRGFIHFEDFFQTPGEYLIRPFFGRVFDKIYHRIFKYSDFIGRRSAADETQSVINWIGQKPENPFFVFVNYIDTHDPYLPPQPYRSMFSTQANPGGILNNELGRKDPQLTPEQAQGEIDAYDGAINYVDKNIGDLVREAEIATGGNLLVIITSDHGEGFNEHNTYLHGRSLYREEIQVPLIINSPAGIPANQKIDQPVSLISIPATILDIVGIEPPKEFTGKPLSDLWNTQAVPSGWDDPLAEIAQHDWDPEKSPVFFGWIKSLINPAWQYIEYENKNPEIFSVQDDPNQTLNLAGESEMSSILKQFQEKMTSLLQGSNQP